MPSINKAIFRRCFDHLFGKLPDFLHQGILKSYANQPDLTLRSGFRCFPQNFYSPLVDPKETDLKKLGQKRELAGIRINQKSIFEWVEKIAVYAKEFEWASRDERTGQVPWSETYTTFDSVVLYCLLRHLKPKQYIEVGCGVSSKISSEALRANEQDGVKAEAFFIEPYPGERLKGFNLYGELLSERIENVPLDLFRNLSSNDVLFIDTSHVLKCQNDVERELLHILPNLRKGVMVHIHDIYTPYEQPEDWLLGRYAPGFANEQYALEALLSGGSSFEICLPLHLIKREHPHLAKSLLDTSQDRGQAMWIRKS